SACRLSGLVRSTCRRWPLSTVIVGRVLRAHPPRCVTGREGMGRREGGGVPGGGVGVELMVALRLPEEAAGAARGGQGGGGSAGGTRRPLAGPAVLAPVGHAGLPAAPPAATPDTPHPLDRQSSASRRA